MGDVNGSSLPEATSWWSRVCRLFRRAGAVLTTPSCTTAGQRRHRRHADPGCRSHDGGEDDGDTRKLHEHVVQIHLRAGDIAPGAAVSSPRRTPWRAPATITRTASVSGPVDSVPATIAHGRATLAPRAMA